MLRRKNGRSPEPEEAKRPRRIGAVVTGDHLSVINWDAGFLEPLEGFDEMISLTLGIIDLQGGFEGPEEAQHLQDLADAFEAAASGHARLVGSLTGGGEKRFFYYAQDHKWVAAHEAQLRSEGRHFTIAATLDPNWTRYRTYLEMAEHADADRRVFTQLQESGADLELPYKIDWYLTFPTEDQAQRADALLQQHDMPWQVELSREGTDGQWSVVSSLVHPISGGYIAEMTKLVGDFARAEGGSYDGWGAEVEPHESV